MQDGQAENTGTAEVNQFHAELARKIVGVACEHGYPAGYQLKEQWLASELGLSRSPVRAALHLLGRLGVVETIPNQGCFLTRPAKELGEGNWGLVQTGEERLYNALSRDRYARRLEQHINVTGLVRRYNTSRSLVERVLSRLADEGLVERETGRGWRFVPTIDNPSVYVESYRFRLTIEPMAIRDPGFSPDSNRLGELKSLHEELIAELAHTLPSRRLVEVDAEFHEAIGAWSNNRFILQAIQQQTRLRRLMEFQFSAAEPERMTQSCREHLAILNALEAGEREKAANLMRQHIEVSRDVLPEFVRDLRGSR
ncbi:MAG: GntR family transcriptional regulator [Alphaproteobacteria bacterium]|nr:GntR family transcriptional regulator [Alphaproteobacteria bacterium]